MSSLYNPPPSITIVGLFSQFEFQAASYFSPLDSTTYYLSRNPSFPTQVSDDVTGVTMSFPGRVIAAEATSYVAGTQGSSENSTVAVKINDSASENVSTVFKHDQFATRMSVNNRAMNLTFAAGDKIDVCVTTPAFATDPTVVLWTVDLTIELYR